MRITGKIVDIPNRTIFGGCVVVENGHIAAITQCDVPDNAPYLMPGFIDAHIHIESTLLTPSSFGPIALKQGTVAVVADPHEIANVLGVEGVNWMIEDSRRTPLYCFFSAPSCVPSTPLDVTGGVVDSDEVAQLMANPDVYCLGEMMWADGVIDAVPEVMKKIAAAHNNHKPIDGHAPGVTGSKLRQYAAAGISTDHECVTIEEARERLANGVKVLIREGSAAKNLDALQPLLAEGPADMLMLCTDDKHPDDLLEGHINLLVRRCIAAGLPLWNVLQAACVNAINHYNLPVGMLRVGDSADFIVVDNLSHFGVLRTYIGGVCVSPTESVSAAPKQDLPNRFTPNPISAQDIRVAEPPTTASGNLPLLKVIGVAQGSIITSQLLEAPAVEDHAVVADTDRDILKLVMVDRYTHRPPQVAFVKGFKFQKGAIGCSIAHDSHNILAVGADDESLVAVVNEIIRLRGALAVSNGSQLLSLPLPAAGLMSPLSAHEVKDSYVKLKAMHKQLGACDDASFMTLSFMALPVIPALKLTLQGLYDTEQGKIVSLFADECFNI
ncbi:MAG: adenine deaminase [Bacteroidales bacterium]|nr:adenine deaminase [Candidatus Colimorpha onthohippi]